MTDSEHGYLDQHSIAITQAIRYNTHKA